jgi:thiamine-phosphate pyrophosphorylase
MNKLPEESKTPLSQTYRIIDANLNRLREGIRVVEDICRYYKNSHEFSSKLKKLRHLARVDEYKILLQSRDIINDPLKETTKSEKSRDTLESIVISNLKRAQESARVLEEVYKLEDTQKAENFKYIRYELYDIEKELLT